MTTKCTIQFNQSSYKQIDGCPIVRPLSVILADIYLVRSENEVAKSMHLTFFKQFVDNIYIKGSKFFEALNDFHANIKLTVEVNPEEIFGTENILNNADAGTIKEH